MPKGKENHPDSSSFWRRLWRDLRVFVRLFPWRVGLALLVGIAGMAAIFQRVYAQVYRAPDFTYIKAVYAILNMMSFQISYADMPPGPTMDLFFVVVPLIGIPLVLVFGANILNVLRVFFVRDERGQRWQEALASTLEHPIIICGVEDRIGYRVAHQIKELERDVVGVENKPGPLAQALTDQGIPVIFGDPRQEEVLRSAGIRRAREVIICSHHDLDNIETAFRVRELNPRARIVMRLFEDEMAPQIQASFSVAAIISRSAVAAQAFARAALGVKIIETFEMGAGTYVLAEIPMRTLCAEEEANSTTVGALADTRDLTVACLYREGDLMIEPPAEIRLHPRDVLYAFTALDNLSSANSPRDGADPAPIVVCGLGHTGYRVVQALRELHCPVKGLSRGAGRLARRLQQEGVPILYGDYRQLSVLEEAGIQEAAAIITCTEDAMVNFETALRARELNPAIRVVLRIFEEALGAQLQQAFDIDAVYSSSAIAAPDFVSAALKIHLAQPVTVAGEHRFIARLTIETLSGLYRESLATLNAEEDLTVLLHKTSQGIHIPPELQRSLVSGDEIVVLASHQKLRQLSLRNRSSGELR